MKIIYVLNSGKYQTYLISSDWMESLSESKKSEFVPIIQDTIFYEICQFRLLLTSIDSSRLLTRAKICPKVMPAFIGKDGLSKKV